MEEVERRACQAHWPKAWSQPSTSTGHLFPMKLKKFLTLPLCSLMALPILPLWALSQAKNPHVFSEAQKQNKAWCPDSLGGGQLPILVLPVCLKALDRKGRRWAFEACRLASEHGYVEREFWTKPDISDIVSLEISAYLYPELVLLLTTETLNTSRKP